MLRVFALQFAALHDVSAFGTVLGNLIFGWLVHWLAGLLPWSAKHVKTNAKSQQLQKTQVFQKPNQTQNTKPKTTLSKVQIGWLARWLVGRLTERRSIL